MTLRCDDCGRSEDQVPVDIVSADYGRGAFLAVLCADCDHRRWYRAELLRRKTVTLLRQDLSRPV